MKHNIRPFSVTFLGAATALLLALYMYQGVGSIGFIFGICGCNILLGYLVGKSWPVYPWQIAILASIPSWLFLAWRMYSSHDPYNIGIDFSLFLWLPIISLFSAYGGTYGARWLSISRRKKAASEE